LSQADPLIDWFVQYEPQHFDRILLTPGDPTTEMLACCMMAKLNAFLAADGGRLFCAEIRIEETLTNAVIFDGDPAAVLPATAGSGRWWDRADMSINDFRVADDGATPLLVRAAE